jgi:membrane-associated protein
MCAVVVAAAIAGDSVGYEVGARYGDRLVSARVLRRRADRVEEARANLARRGGPAVFLARLVAFLRAVMPFLAGTSHMDYPKFLAYNAAGGLVWGVGTVMLGFLAGNSYAAAERAFGRAVALILAAVAVSGLVVWYIRRRRRDRR